MTTMVRFYGPFVLYSRTSLTDICATQKGIHEEMLVSFLLPLPRRISTPRVHDPSCLCVADKHVEEADTLETGRKMRSALDPT